MEIAVILLAIGIIAQSIVIWILSRRVRFLTGIIFLINEQIASMIKWEQLATQILGIRIDNESEVLPDEHLDDRDQFRPSRLN